MALPFLNPWMLAALPAAAIPVIIHLLNRHRSVTIEWGAMELLRRVMVFRSRQIRLEDLLLMAVRCVLIGLVVLAAARPTTRLAPAVRKPDVGVVVAVDTSLSMSHRAGASSRLDEAARRVREILAGVEPARPVTLVAMAGRPRVLLRSVGYEPARVEQALRELRATSEPLNLEACLAELGGLAAELKVPRREVYLVTDAQAGTLGRVSDRAREILRGLAGEAAVLVVASPFGSEENVGVTRLELASGVLRAGAIARFGATVRNPGRGAQDAGELSLLLNEQLVDKRFIGRLAAGQAVAVRLYAPLERAGVARLTARLGEDALAADNVRHAVVDVRAALRVLCVDGDAADRGEGRAAALVATALAPSAMEGGGLLGAGEARPSVETTPWTALSAARLADYDVVVLVNVPDVAEERAVALRKFVEQGGGLIVLPGNNTKIDALNERLGAAGAALLPAEVLPAEADRGVLAEALPLDLDLGEHPLAEPLKSLPKELLGEARFTRFLPVRPVGEARMVLRLAHGEPLLLERLVGRGKVLLWTSGADRTWNNLALNPALPMLMQQAVTYLARQPFETPVIVPEPIVLPLASMAAGEEVAVTGPEGGQAGVVRATVRAGEVVAETPATGAPGFYEFQPRPAGAAMTVAANVDPAECDVKVLGAEELARAFAGLPVRVLPATANVAAAVAEARNGRELWQILLIAAVALLAMEALLARWTTRRGQ
jgi:hypothetical protein